MSKHQRSMSAVAVRACHCMEACLANCRKMRPPRDVVASQQPPLFRKSKLRSVKSTIRSHSADMPGEVPWLGSV